jgi:hypothetical protein
MAKIIAEHDSSASNSFDGIVPLTGDIPNRKFSAIAISNTAKG